MKYEMIFGEQLLFDGAPDDVVAVRLNNYSRISYGYLTKEKLDALSVMDLKAIPIVAMRRIIKEPKRWTVADQKAGRLPEVGSIVSSVAYGYTCYVVAIDSNSRHIWCQFPDQSVGSCMIFEINPIETPDEKAQREEDEFVNALVSEYNKMPSSTSFKAGIRAAYRKLKGGE